VDFVRRWIGRLRAAGGAKWLGQCSVLVRPHPANDSEWASADLSDLPGVAVWSRRSTMNADQGLYDSLFPAAAVVGLNTSAMIEAAIVGRPVFTIETPENAGGQSGTLHFHYLLVENGGVLTVADSFEEHVRQLEAAPDDSERTRERSHRFLEAFVRPRGIDVPAAGIMAEEVERAAALRKKPRPAAWWHYPVRWALRRFRTVIIASLRPSPHRRD
jgi:hypothetical protein